MNSQDGPSGPTPVLAQEVLRTLATLAAGVLSEHTESQGHCAACGSDWPCRRVATAANNLAVL
jgi:hypothetical protein